MVTFGNSGFVTCCHIAGLRVRRLPDQFQSEIKMLKITMVLILMLSFTNLFAAIIHDSSSRDKVVFLEKKKSLTVVSLYTQNKLAPLIFLIPGIGGISETASIKAQSETLFELGYHVAILPSPLHRSFVLAENPAGVAGFSPNEARKLFNYMSKIIPILKTHTKTPVSGHMGNLWYQDKITAFKKLFIQ